MQDSPGTMNTPWKDTECWSRTWFLQWELTSIRGRFSPGRLLVVSLVGSIVLCMLCNKISSKFTTVQRVNALVCLYLGRFVVPLNILILNSCPSTSRLFCHASIIFIALYTYLCPCLVFGQLCSLVFCNDALSCASRPCLINSGHVSCLLVKTFVRGYDCRRLDWVSEWIGLFNVAS